MLVYFNIVGGNRNGLFEMLYAKFRAAQLLENYP